METLEGRSHAVDPRIEGDVGHVQHALNEILASPPFRSSQQSQNLLRYIVEHSLTHEDHLLRERVIGAAVFGRRPGYETGEDPVVRVRAAEIRKRLAQYYQSFTDPVSCPELRIEIPSGSYRATFRWHDEEKAAHSPAEHQTLPLPGVAHASPLAMEVPALVAQTAEEAHGPAAPGPARPGPAQPFLETGASRRRLHASTAWLVAVLVGVLVVGSVAWLWKPFQQRSFHAFWQPWLGSNRPVIIAMGSNAVYRLSEDLTEQYARQHGLEMHGLDFFVPIDPQMTIQGRDLLPAPDSFVALGDVAAVSAVIANLSANRKNVQERFPNDISFAELRNSATVLIGGFNNPMTIELTKGLPFVLRARNEIDDTRSGRRWLLHASEDSHDTEDYAIVTRLARKNGDAPLLGLAGMGQYGTLAAANFVCNPIAIAELAKGLPNHWSDRNLQIVLHVKVVDFKPAAVEVVANSVW